MKMGFGSTIAKILGAPAGGGGGGGGPGGASSGGLPASIPYDPSLVLGNVVTYEKLQALVNLANAQAPASGAQDDLNDAVLALRSLDMTMSELMGLGIAIDQEILDQRKANAEKVKERAIALAKARVASIDAVTKARRALTGISYNIESPVDFNRTQIKKLPLAADSLKMNAQYFSFDKNEQTAANTVAAISAFVSQSTEFLGDTYSSEATAAVQTQINQQRQDHDIAGTLIITASCTHKDAAMLAPFYLDVDKAIRVWNALSGPEDKFSPTSLASMSKILALQGTDKEKQIMILSGAAYGSSFIGMVHVLRNESTTTSQTMVSVAASLQENFEVGCFFANETGSFGIESQFATDAKRMLSMQQISSHVTMVTVGAIPSIKSNEVKLAVKEFADFDPAAMMGKLANLANATASAQKSVQESAAASRNGSQMMAIRGAEIKSVLTSVGEIQDGANKMLDINSMMTSFEDYVNKALAGQAGVPITYYMKPITASELAQMWVAKYFPGKYVTSAGDDSTPVEPNHGGGGGGGGEANNP
ncbi:MAG: hypothetical protein H6710_07685 [Myxococcales bacterium]|nr:hypothetical protein [Myxococcales bacterium]